MTQTPEIKLLAFYKNGKKVVNKEDANFISYSVKDDKETNFLHIIKDKYDGYRSHPKPVKKWSELPAHV